jgi:hypothetical protein
MNEARLILNAKSLVRLLKEDCLNGGEQLD